MRWSQSHMITLSKMLLGKRQKYYWNTGSDARGTVQSLPTPELPPTLPTHSRAASTDTTHFTLHTCSRTCYRTLYKSQQEKTNLRWGGLSQEISRYVWCNINPLIPPSARAAEHMTLESGCFTHESDLGCVCVAPRWPTWRPRIPEYTCDLGTNNLDLHQIMLWDERACILYSNVTYVATLVSSVIVNSF